MPGLRQPEVAAATEPAVPEPVGTATGSTRRSTSREAQRRIALFVLVLVVAGGAAWGAGRLLSRTLQPAPAVPPTNHQMMPGMSDMPDMPGMTDMPGMAR